MTTDQDQPLYSVSAIAERHREKMRAKGWTDAQLAAIERHADHIEVTEPRTEREQQALDAALFERARADKLDLALRSALCNMEQGSYAVAKAQIRIALLQ